MSKIIAIDYGKKRIGVAETDDMQIIGSPLDTIENSMFFNFFAKYISQNQVEIVVIGQPKTLDNQLNDLEEDIKKFIVKFQKLYPLMKIERLDERFTSKMASFAISQSGMAKNKRQNKELIDKISACLILNSYLETKSNLK